MKLKRIRQEDLLEVFGVTTRGAVGHYLTGRRQPTPDQIKALAAHLGCTIDDLLSDESIDIVRQRMCDILDAADLRMKKSQHQFTDEERISVYRSVIASCLDMRVDNNQVNSYLDVLIKNNNH
ncbi:MAG: helix-turn-helix domain-containing protein [Gammaproteobacteria bacterium]